jgi:hypothetical protein
LSEKTARAYVHKYFPWEKEVAKNLNKFLGTKL